LGGIALAFGKGKAVLYAQRPYQRVSVLLSDFAVFVAMIYRHDARPSGCCNVRHRSLLALDLRCLELQFFRKKFEDYSRAFIGRS
jgi:hypothetical protein